MDVVVTLDSAIDTCRWIDRCFGFLKTAFQLLSEIRSVSPGVGDLDSGLVTSLLEYGSRDML